MINREFIQPILQDKYKTKNFNIKTNSFVKTFDEQQLHLIYKVKIPKHFTLDSDTADAPWISSFQGSRRAMRWLKTPSEMIACYASWVGFDPKPLVSLLDYPLSIVLPLFKRIKIWCHTHYDQYGSSVRYFVDLDSLSGIPPQSIRTMGDDPEKWLTTLVSSDYDRTFWSEQFKQTFCNFATNTTPTLMTLDEFTISRWMWVTEGATKFSKLMLDDEIVKTKFGAAVSLTDEELLKIVAESRNGSQPIGVFIKGDESSFKRRLIANVPLGGYIIASYVRYLIEQFCGKVPGFEKLSPSFSDKINVINLLREGRVCFPLDESAYDYHVTRESWLGFFDFLKLAFPNNEGVTALQDYFDHAFWQFDGKKGKWLKGMPSGLALTTMLNSWMNYIKQKTIVVSDFHWACGDDVLTFPFDQTVTLKQIEEAYARFGSDANAAKNWKSYRFGEYLKTIYGTTGTSGYPARIFGSLLFTQDLSFRRPDEKLYELVDLWKQLFDRLGIPMDEKVVARDLANAISHKVVGFNQHVAMDWMHSPKIHGGFGKLPYNNLTFTWEMEERKFKNYYGARYRLPSVIEYYGQVNLKIGTYVRTTSNYKLGEAYHLPPVTNEMEWERRLNREDIPDHGPYSSMILDIIPLPVMDFISVANMSAFAYSNGFNIYPNLTGKWNSISSRLINASIALVEFVTSTMTNHNLTMLV